MVENDYGAQESGKQPDVAPERKALVDRWMEDITAAEKHYEKAFKKMRQNMAFAARGAEKDWIESEKYVVPIVNRHINQSVSQLYAKNPRVTAKRKRRLMYKLWDGRPDSLQMAAQDAAMGDPNAMALVQEVMSVRNYTAMLTRMGSTLEALWDYYIAEQAYNYKQQLKAAVRRAKVCGVAYVKLGFQRILQPRPEVTAQIEDVTAKIKVIETTLAAIAEGKVSDTAAEMDELKSLLRDLQAQPELVVREGPIFDFPRATEILVDPGCKHLKSLAGARWVIQVYDMRPERVREIYGVDITGCYTPYRPGGTQGVTSDPEDGKSMARVYEGWDKRNQQTWTLVRGYHDFVVEPKEPDLKIERFWPFFPLVFNEIEHDEELYPPSDVEQTQHIQNEYNRSREALRQHRIAARPYYLVGPSVEDEDVKRIASHADHEVIRVPALLEGQKAEDLVQRGPAANIDPNLYEVEMHFSDLLRVVGSQEANLGGVSGGTATESSIAEQSRSTSLSDNVDDLDEMLSDLAKSFGQLCMTELSYETVIEIVGEGAVWPTAPQTRAEVAKDLLLDVRAGSSGRPNRASELANMERGIPLMLQLPGVNPTPITRKYVELLDLDLDEAIAEGMPSITALNAMMAKTATAPGAEPTGRPDTDPNAQGANGSQNAPSTQQNEPGPQPGYPAPAPIA